MNRLLEKSKEHQKIKLIRKHESYIRWDGSHWYLQDIHPNAEEYTFFSSAHGTLSRIDHILGHKSNLSKFKKIKIISSIFSDQNAMRLVNINYKEKTVKNTGTWRLNNMFLSNEQVTEEIKEQIKKFLETNDNENMTTQTYEIQQKQFWKGSL